MATRVSRVLLLPLLLSSCFFVSQNEFEAAWDIDGDSWPNDEDCDPYNPQIYPGAPDRRGDGCDADCGVVLDSDGDDWPDGSDCYQPDASIFPCAPDVPGDDIDSDCDGLDTPRTDVCTGEDPNGESPVIDPADCNVGPIGGGGA